VIVRRVRVLLFGQQLLQGSLLGGRQLEHHGRAIDSHAAFDPAAVKLCAGQGMRRRKHDRFGVLNALGDAAPALRRGSDCENSSEYNQLGKRTHQDPWHCQISCLNLSRCLICCLVPVGATGVAIEIWIQVIAAKDVRKVP